MKVCFKCGKAKPIDEFYRHKQMGDGHLGKCKSCTKRDVLLHRLLHLERIRAYDRIRGSRQTAEDRKRYRNTNPEKYKAHSKIGNSLRDGHITKPDYCTVCGVTGVRIHGHHTDYGKPLEVLWCCSVCHRAQHARLIDGIASAPLKVRL